MLIPGGELRTAAHAPFTTPADAVVEIAPGKLRGYRQGDVYGFLGIPYGQSTAGAGRFRPARAPEPWAGVRTALSFGAICPQHVYAEAPSGGPRLLDMPQYNFESEDCLNLNVWARELTPGRRRPVMVWLHGGAFLMGSANRTSTRGANLALNHDVVVVTIHHRLNVLGHLDLSAVSDEFADSANAGILDIVTALEWVRANIEQFGGDPDNVTVFGQSGGGAKVATLMMMPSATGLFHRAVVMSSSAVVNTAERAATVTERFLEQLGVTTSNLDPLFDLDARQLVDAATAASGAPLAGGVEFRPKIDERVLLRQPFTAPPDGIPASVAYDAGVPILFGGTRHEFAPEPDRGPVDDDTLYEALTGTVGAPAARQITGELRALYPGISNNELLALVNVQPFRAAHYEHIARGAARPSGTIHAYNFAWTTPNLDGLPLAYHGSELPFVFCNVEEAAPLTANDDTARDLAAVMSASWVSFAETGDPGRGAGLTWSPFDPERENTMIFDTACGEVDHPWADETAAIVAAAGGMFAKPPPARLLRA